MAAEYSAIAVQTVAEDGNVLFANGSRCCRKGFITHRDSSGVFRLKGANNTCRSVYRVQFDANIAIPTGGTVGPISVSLVIDGEVVGNAVAIVTPTVVASFFNVSLATFVDVPCGCCATVAVENTSDTAILVENANIIFERVA